MKPTALLINTAVEKLLMKLIYLKPWSQGRLPEQAFDVIDGEWLEQDKLKRHPLIEYSRLNNNLLIVPHIGGSTAEFINLARIFMARKIVNYFTNSQY